MNFDILQIPSKEIFDDLYDNHTYYLNIPELPEISSRTQTSNSFKRINESGRTRKVTSSKKNDFRNLKNTDEHIEYLCFLQNEYETRFQSAKKIQKYWKCYMFRKTFFNIKNLINKYMKMDPGLVLRTVNPREASLLDSGSGTRVKFKLTGTVFPPIIVYKIFSYRPVVNVNSLPSINVQNFFRKQVNDFNVMEIDQPTKSKSTTQNSVRKKASKVVINDWRPYQETYDKKSNYISGNFRITSRHNKMPRNNVGLKVNKPRTVEMEWIKTHYEFKN